MNIQKIIDELIARFPAIAEMTGWVKYVGPGQPLPVGTTHTLKFANTSGQEIVVAFQINAPYAYIVDTLLRLL